jgi:hypothetical protein
MTINQVVTPFAVAAALALTSPLAFADQHRGGHSEGRSSSGYHGSASVRVAPRAYAPRVYAPRVYAPRVYAPYYARPYYSFRPHVSVGFGLWLGYPVAYPYYYSQPYPVYPYSDPYTYGPYAAAPSYGSSSYPPDGYGAARSAPSSVVPQGGAQYDRGGVSFQITPEDATVFVDGAYVGTAGQFGPEARPLDLTAGPHRIEVRAPGYRTMAFDADVRPGQVLPYQGTLQRN